MDAKVIRPFYDLQKPDCSYNVGDVFTGTEERVRDLAEKGFVEKPKAPARKRAPKQQK